MKPSNEGINKESNYFGFQYINSCSIKMEGNRQLDCVDGDQRETWHLVSTKNKIGWNPTVVNVEDETLQLSSIQMPKYSVQNVTRQIDSILAKSSLNIRCKRSLRQMC